VLYGETVIDALASVADQPWRAVHAARWGASKTLAVISRKEIPRGALKK
jgi:hypothetical protein